MPTITVEGGASNWRELFLDRPGLAVTPENHDRLLAEREAAAAPAPVAEPEPVKEEQRPAPRTPPRRLPPAAAAEGAGD